MRLSQLMQHIGTPVTAPDDAYITGIALDSRAVRSGELFAALPGSKVDGARFVAAAIEKGAAAVLASNGADVGDVAIPVIRVENPKRAVALLAGAFYAPQPEAMLAVTGTSGKTSVADFTRQILLHCQRRAASVGTIGVITEHSADYGSLTTPDAVTLHKTLQSLAQRNIDHVVMEASSHGLDQYRLDGAMLQAAAFTNLGRDHLDYHADMDSYLAAKLRLFSDILPSGAAAVVNTDDNVAARVVDVVNGRGQRLIDVGRTAQRIRLAGVARDGFQQIVSLQIDGNSYDVRLNLVGDYQIENILVAAGLALATGIEPDPLVAALGKLKGVPGRLEIVGVANGALLVVDYAHKPEALEAALRACRPFAKGRLTVVFGCGGDRDKGKRPLMGRIARDGADIAIVTDDNPRTEASSAIRADIIGNLSGLVEIGDRREAIRHAVKNATAGDVVLVAGKGHETGQIFGTEVIPFSDHDELAAAMEMGTA